MSPWVLIENTSRRLSGGLMAKRSFLSGDIASGRTWPLSNNVNDELVAAGGVAAARSAGTGTGGGPRSAPSGSADTPARSLSPPGASQATVAERPRAAKLSNDVLRLW